jgi:Fic family protein
MSDFHTRAPAGASVTLVPKNKITLSNYNTSKTIASLKKKKLLMILSNDTINKYTQQLQNKGLCQKNAARSNNYLVL